jgi:hypothetical protein
MVPHEHYERLKELNDRVETILIDIDENERQRELHVKV